MNAMVKTNGQAAEMEALLTRSMGGDPKAFEALVRNLQPMVMSIAMGFFHDRDEALEVLQETFLRVYRNLHRVDRAVGLRSWVYRIATNIAIDRYRSHRKQGEHRRHLQLLESVGARDEEGPGERLQATERQRHLKAAVEDLSERERAVFVLKHFKHMKLKEIAHVLDISVGTVKSTHFRAVNHLRRAVAAGGEV